MLFPIIVVIVIIFIILSIIQKNQEQKAFRLINQMNGGFRMSFPKLITLLEKDLEMGLVMDSGDHFFYQKDIVYNKIQIGKVRIGRKIEYSKSNLLYTLFIPNYGPEVAGVPISFEDDIATDLYKEYIKKSLLPVVNQSIELTNTPFFLCLFSDIVNSKDKTGTNILREYECFYQNALLTKLLKKTEIIKNGNTIKREIFRVNNSQSIFFSSEILFYEKNRISLIIEEDFYFILSNTYSYNENNLLYKIETDSQHKEFTSIRKYVSKTITYNENHLPLVEISFSSRGEIYDSITYQYDANNNRVFEEFVEGSSYKKFEYSFDNKNRVIEKKTYNKKDGSPTITIYEYDDINYELRITVKLIYKLISSITILNYDSNWVIQKSENFLNGGNIGSKTFYTYVNSKINKIEGFDTNNNLDIINSYIYENEMVMTIEKRYNDKKITSTVKQTYNKDIIIKMEAFDEKDEFKLGYNYFYSDNRLVKKEQLGVEKKIESWVEFSLTAE